MQKIALKSLLVASLSLFTMPTFAVNIQNLTVTPNGRTYLEFSWEKLGNTDIDQETHYGLQWNTSQTKIRIDEPTDARTSTTNNTFEMIRGSDIFEKDTDYYVRVYGFYSGEMERKNYLTKGSKILKFKWLNNGNVETSYIEANDPTIVSSNATTTVAKTFQNISSTAYDTSVQLNWSHTTDEIFDEYTLVLGTESTLANPIAEFNVDTSYNKALIMGLTPGKKYYIAGYLKSNGQNYGKGNTINFTTLTKFDDNKQARFEKYILAKKKYGVLLNTGIAPSTTTTATVSTSTVTTSSSSVAISARITELKKLIAQYQAEIKRLGGSTTTTSRLSSRNISTAQSQKSTSSLSSRLAAWRARR